MFLLKLIAFVLATLMPALASPTIFPETEVNDPMVQFGMNLLQHVPQALANLHSTPTCGQLCLLFERSREAAPACSKYWGPDRYACFCRSPAYQFHLDKCFNAYCDEEERALVCPFLFGSRVWLIFGSPRNWVRRVVRCMGFRGWGGLLLHLWDVLLLLIRRVVRLRTSRFLREYVLLD
jgi:CFEM domain